MIGVTLAAEASKNLENVESQSEQLDRGCVSRKKTTPRPKLDFAD